MVIMLIFVAVSNILSIKYFGDGNPSPSARELQISGSVIICNLQHTDGNEILFFVEFCVLFSFKLITLLMLIFALCFYIKASKERKKCTGNSMIGYQLCQKLLCAMMCFFELFASAVVMQVFITVFFELGDGEVKDNLYIMCAFIFQALTFLLTMGMIMGIYHRKAKQLLNLIEADS